MPAGVQKYRKLIIFAIIIFSCQSLLAMAVGRYVEGAALERDSRATQQILQIFYASSGLDGQNIDPEPSSADFKTFGPRIVALPGMVRANIYSADRYIRFSSDSNLIGIKFSGNEELDAAFAGQVIVALNPVDGDAKPEHLALAGLRGGASRLIEAYIPLRDRAGQIAAVVEYYKKPDELEQSGSSTTWMIWFASLLSGLAIVGLSLGLLVRPAPSVAEKT